MPNVGVDAWVGFEIGFLLAILFTGVFVVVFVFPSIVAATIVATIGRPTTIRRGAPRRLGGSGGATGVAMQRRRGYN